MDAIAYENDHYSYAIQNVQNVESGMAADNDEITIWVDPTSGTVRFDYSPKASGNSQYEQFWESARGWVSGRFGVILGEVPAREGTRYFSIALDRGKAGGLPRNIHVYVSRPEATEAPAPDDGSWNGQGK